MPKIKIIQNLFIPLSNSCYLAAKIWMPEDAYEHPVPAILDYIPYRKRDGTALRDHQIYPYFAENGYVCVRVDIRGSGESNGLLLDEYLKQEQDDCLEVLTWIAKQTWCSGNIGMMGKSWGGFSSLQVAARQHPNLKSVISVCSTDNRFTDDIHYMGGCLITDNFQWSSLMMGMLSQPPDKALVGEKWRDEWLQRLNHMSLLSKRWTQHRTYDEYWKHGSIAEDWSAIKCPVYLITGWADGYVNTVPRILENLKVPRKGLIGPWAHCYPHLAQPGPEIGFLQEALRWWDHWLKGMDTGIMNEPMYRVWMQDSIWPAPRYETRPGRWVAEEALPTDHVQFNQLFLTNDNKICSTYSSSVDAIVGVSPQSVGETAGTWCGYGAGPEKPTDQRIDDARSICFDSSPFTETIEILGRATINLNVIVDKSDAFLAVRLNEVFPDGSSSRISYGVLNLKHREGHEKEVPIKPGDHMQVTVPLKNIAHSFKPGNHLRIAISTTYWPLVWPSSEVTKLSVFPGKSSLELPVRARRPSDDKLPAFEEPYVPPPLDIITHRSAYGTRRVERDIGLNMTTISVEENWRDVTYKDNDLRNSFLVQEVYSIADNDPLSASANIHTINKMSRGDWKIRTEIHSKMTVDENYYYQEALLSAYENDELVLTRKWHEKTERTQVANQDALLHLSGTVLSESNLFSKSLRRDEQRAQTSTEHKLFSI